ncbi:MAG TPA: hypothetical protein VHI10_18130 [Mycobacterium sp.]|nr:hypothetical protein [Mycobacterium sp.]
MSTEERQQTETDPRENAEPKTDEHHQVVEKREPPPPTEKPEVTEEHKERAKEMKETYEDDRPTTTMPGTGGAVAGTAVNEWVDDEGNPKFADESKE